VPLAGVPLLGHALHGVLSCAAVAEVVLVVPDTHRAQSDELAEGVCRELGSATPVTVVPGGAERGDSVAAGLRVLGGGVDIVLVHDAARCLTPVDVFDRVVAAVAAGAVAVVPGTAVIDTIKQVDGDGFVVGTPDRSGLRAVQTPQGFRRDVLERAHAVSSDATDDAGLVERLGERVLVVEGDPRALKVTTPSDLEAAARLLGAS
jgi:2-C-methyl-D-erythritol 4-phosphate cytidylyltransferase